MQHAVEHQDQLETALEGDVSLTDVLVAAKLLANGETDGRKFPALKRVGVAAIDGVMPMEQHTEELRGIRASLSE